MFNLTFANVKAAAKEAGLTLIKCRHQIQGQIFRFVLDTPTGRVHASNLSELIPYVS